MKTRSYHSKTREAQASETRSRILETAKKLFQEEGFDRVTIQNIAQAARVSIPTIYALFKSKRGLLQSLIDNALPPQCFDALVEASFQELCPKKRLATTARLARHIYDAEKELMNLLQGASFVAPELKELEQEREKRRYERQNTYVKQLKEDNVLAEGLSLKKARDLLWALTGRDLYRLLVIEKGWSSEQYEIHLAEILIHSLLHPSIQKEENP